MVGEHFDINEQLSPTEEPARYHGRSEAKEDHMVDAKFVQVVDEKDEPDRKAEPKRALVRPVPPMFAQHRAPMGWLGNAVRRHDESAEVCLCSKCYIRAFSGLEEGPAHQVHEAYGPDTPQMRELVGLYDHSNDKLTLQCRVCRRAITLEGRTASKFDEHTEEVVHVSCMSDDDALALERIGYKLPHLVVARRKLCETCTDAPDDCFPEPDGSCDHYKERADGDVQTGEGPEDHDSDGGSPPGPDGGDEQAGDGAE